MTWTYGDPAANSRSAVRLLSGDTDQSADVTLTDAEVDYLLGVWGNVFDAAAASCETRAAQYANKASGSKRVGDLNLAIDYEKSARGLLAMAERLHEQGAREDPPLPWVDPDSLKTVERKAGRVPTTEFFTGMFDNRRGDG